MSNKYLINDKINHEIFLRVDRVLKEDKIPVMSNLAKEEINFIQNNTIEGDKIIEIGCGSGRVLKSLKDRPKIFGTEKNKFFLENTFPIFKINALKKVPKPHRNNYDKVLICYNLYQNFNQRERKQIVKHAKDLVHSEGTIILTLFHMRAMNKGVKEQIKKYYRLCINPKKNQKITSNKNGFFLSERDKIKWQSIYGNKNKLIDEISKIKNIKIKKIHPLLKDFGTCLILSKKD